MSAHAHRDPTIFPALRSLDHEKARLHATLAAFNHARLSPQRPHEGWRETMAEELRLATLEGQFVERERHSVAHLLDGLPTDPDGFLAWFEALERTGPGQHDPLFPWLAEQATLEEMRWFLTQEVAGEAGFDDLVALTQVKMPTRPKLEMARNYWDEMGHGQEAGMHGPMLGRLATALALAPTPESTVWEAVALGNLMAALACNRRYAYQSAGALGAIELTAPGRAALVAQGLKRLDVAPKVRLYFELHAVLDVKHAAAWNAEVIRPLVEQDSSLAQPLAEGALMRLVAGQRCFARYKRALGLAF